MSEEMTEVRTLLMQAQEQGFDAVADKIMAYSQRVVAADNAQRALTKVQSDTNRTVASAARAWDAQTRAFDMAARAQQNFSRELSRAKVALDQGLISTQAYAERAALLEAHFEREAHAAASASAAAGLNRMQLLELTHVGKSLVDQLAAGASPMRALEVEGGRIAQVFAEGKGGVTGTLKAIGSALGGVVTGISPVTAGIAAAAGVAIAGAAAWWSYTEAAEKAGSAVTGVGKMTGLSAAGLLDLADRVAAASNVSEASARDLAAEMTRSGRISADIIEKVAGKARDYAATIGTDMKSATTDLAKAFEDPLKGADALNEKLGFLDDTTREHIKTLTEAGNRYEAQQTLLDAMTPSLDSGSSHVTALGDAWAYVASKATQAAFAMGKALDAIAGYGTAEEKLKNLRSNMTNPGQIFMGGLMIDHLVNGKMPNLKDQEAYLEEQVRMNAHQRDAQARTIEQNQLSLEVGKKARASIPGLKRYEDMKADNLEAERTLALPGSRSKMDIDIITRAMEGRTNAIKSMTDANGKFITSEENRAAVERLQGKALLDRKNPKAYAADQRRIAELQLYGKEVSNKERDDLLSAAAAKGFDRSTAHASQSDPFGNAFLAAQKGTQEIDLQRQNIGLPADVLAGQKVQLDLLTAAKKDHIVVTEQVMAKIDAEAAHRAAATQALETAKRQYDALNEIEGRLADAGVNLFEGAMQGAKGFQSALRGVISEMEKLLLQSAFEGKGPFAALFGTASSTPGQVGGLFGSLFGNRTIGGNGGGLGGLLGSLFGGAHADGGDIMSGKIGLVGERGPELLRGPASITPLSKLPMASAGGNVTMTINHTMDLSGANGDAAIRAAAAESGRQAVAVAVQQVKQQFPAWQVDLQQRGA